MQVFLGIDVGTGSARAGVFDVNGGLLGTGSKPIVMFRPRPDFAQQSSRDIWDAVCFSVRAAVEAAGVDPRDLAGIGFDATCSLVAVDGGGGPVTVSPDEEADQNVIVWMDHRATQEAEEINAGGHDVLRYTGGVISPEMETPKLLWLKRNLPQSWKRAASFFDLPDWLVHRATGTLTRSLCSTVCKWTYRGQLGVSGEGWDDDFLRAVGLEDLAGNGRGRIGLDFAAPGEAVGSLDAQAAAELGLIAGIPVSASLIDAYAGALGTMCVKPDSRGVASRLAMIAGTSTCHITVSDAPAFVPGVWGPYYSVLMPGLWANEAGQSVAGALIDRLVARHAAAEEANRQAKAKDVSVFDLLDARLAAMAELGDTATLTANRHIQPDFHGNRSPIADPTRKGAVVGLDMNTGIDDLALDYLAGIQALAYGTRQIIAALRDNGVAVETLVVSGGLARNRLFLRENADATGCRILVPDQPEPVLLGGAMLGAVAAGAYRNVVTAMARMAGNGSAIAPRGGDIAAYHDRKYRVFLKMQRDYGAYAAIMTSTESEGAVEQ
jgi:FGGY-family pentulose kinase